MLPPMFKQGAFQVDANATPDQIAAKRAYIAAMMPKFGSARYVGEGLGQLATGVVMGRQNRKLNEAESAGRQSAVDVLERTFGTARSAQSPDVTGPLSVLGMTPQGPAMPPPDPNSPHALGDATMAALGKPAVKTGADAASIKAGLVARGLPDHIADGFVMNMQDESGLNPGINEAAPLVPGSRGGFGLYQLTGPRRRAFEAFAAERGAPLDDVDAQLDFMMMELQGPEKAAWETISGTQNAGEAGAAIVNNFLRPAEEHRASRAARYTSGDGVPSTGAAPAPTSAPSIPINELYMALQNPWMSAEEKGLITSMIQEQQAASDPLRQMELRKAEIELAQLENPTQQPPEDFTARMFTLNSLGIDPQSEEGRSYMLTGNLPEPPEPGYTTMTAEEVAQLGLPPGAYQKGPKGEIKQIGGGGTNVTVNNGGMGVEPLGTEGQILVPDPTQPSGYRVEVAPGSKLAMEAEAAKNKGAKADSNAITASAVITNAADRALEAANARAFGPYGQGIISAINPYSDSREVDRQVDTLKANAASENINAMRQASPTGGALGNASDADIKLLKDKSGALDPSSPNFERDLADYTRTLLRVVHGDQVGDQIFAETWKGKMPEDAAQPATPATEPTKITNDAEYDALPSGTVYVGPDGKKRRKP